MAVVGIDLGTQNAVIAQAVRGGVDVILNESSKRLTPSLVSFVGNERYLGEQAATQVRTNMANTITQVKRLLGRKLSEPGVQAEFENHLNYKAVAVGEDDIGLKVSYNDSAEVFTPAQVLGMLLTKLKEIVQAKNPHVTTADVVLSVPGYFTDPQRQAVRDAAALAGLNCLRVLNEGTAAALTYGIFKSAKREFPDGVETKVLFLDMGFGHFTATVAGFDNGSLRILASESDDSIGSRELDLAIARYFADEFKAKTGLDAWTDRKARLKLLVAAEKAKITITPFGVNTAQAGVECLKEERDFNGSLTLDKLEELSAPSLTRMQEVIRAALAAAKVGAVSELAAVELVGGGMRPRPVKRRAAEALGLPLNEETNHGLATSMNLDEAVARGCALACAMLSPIFRVKPFEIVDMVPAAVRVSWDPQSAADAAGTGATAAAAAKAEAAGAEGGMDLDGGEGEGGAGAGGASSMVLFKVGDPSPVTRRITFRRSAPFDIVAEFDAEAAAGRIAPGHPRFLAKYHVHVPADAVEAGAPAPKIRVDFRHDINGIFSLVKAELLKEIKDAAAPAAATSPAADAAAADGSAAAPAAAEGAAAPPADAAAAAAEADKPAAKKRYKRVELSVTPLSVASGMTPEALAAAAQLEARMTAQDADIHATHDMRNSLETYIYNTRDALLEALAPYGTDDEREALRQALEAAEGWLYDNMEGDKATFADKLAELRAGGDRLSARRAEDEGRAAAAGALLAAIEEFRKVQNNHSGRHGHLSDADRDAIRSACAAAEDWLRAKQEAQAQLPLTADPAVRNADVLARRDALTKELRPIANKPVPAAAAPAAAPQPQAQAPPAPEEAPQAEGQQQQEGGAEMPVDGAAAPAAGEAAGAAPAAPTMEVD